VLFERGFFVFPIGKGEDGLGSQWPAKPYDAWVMEKSRRVRAAVSWEMRYRRRHHRGDRCIGSGRGCEGRMGESLRVRNWAPAP
jgi:hypothetical protein